MVGLSLPEAMAALAPHLPASRDAGLAEHYREGFVAQRAAGGGDAASRRSIRARGRRWSGWRPTPSTLLGVATGKARPGLDHVLRAPRSRGSFFATAPDRRRPSLQAASVDAARGARRDRRAIRAAAVMVGDTEFDIAMGRAAGFATIGVAWGYHPRARLRGRRRGPGDRRLRRARRGARRRCGRRRVSWAPRRRFWQAAAVRPAADGFAVASRRPAAAHPGEGAALRADRALAAAIAAEWNALDDGSIPPARCRSPARRIRRSTASRAQRAAVVAAIAAYGDTDLLCYRAEEPEALRDRQAAAWDPWLDWAARELGAPLVAVAGRDAPARSRPRASRRCAPRSRRTTPFALTALHELVTLSGSLVLGLAVARGALPPADAWALSRIDEDWQAEHWGADAEAEAAAGAPARRLPARPDRLALLAGERVRSTPDPGRHA